MAVRRNGSYTTDPALASAFDNLASAFATPTGADVLGYAKSGAEREKAARLSFLFDNPNDPNFDRKNIAVGNYSPIQSFYAQNQNDGTTRRGQDVSAKASTDVAGINNAGALARQFALPVSAKDGETVMLPEQTAAATGLPGMFRGNVTTKPGDTVTLPGDGGVIRGAPIVPTDSQVKGAILDKLPDAEKRAVATAGISLAPVLDAKGEPTNVASVDAVGRTPYNVDSRQTQVANYKTADGKVGTARLDKDSQKWIDTQTNAELPQGTQTYSANLQGDKDATGLGTSTKNNIDQQLVDLALTESTSKQLRKIVSSNPAVQGLAGHLRGTVQDAIQAGGEVGQLFNVNMAKMQAEFAAGRMDPEVAKRFGNFDPNIPATAMLETMLTAQVAKVLDPNGRISNDRYEQVSKALGAGGILGNTAKTIATLDQLDRMMADRRGILSPVRPEAAKIGQKPGAATSSAAVPAVRTYNPTTGAFE